MSAFAIPLPNALIPSSLAGLARLDEANARILQFPQIDLVTEHLLHGGMYARTIRLAPGVVMMGSSIRAATILIVRGSCAVTTGDSTAELTGYNVLHGSPGRKQLFLTRGSVEMTMIFPTSAETVEDAENEVFAEADQLMSRKDSSKDRITITGE